MPGNICLKQRDAEVLQQNVMQMDDERNKTRTRLRGKRISETTTGFFFLTGQNGSFFLFFRACNPSFHNSGEPRGQIRVRANTVLLCHFLLDICFIFQSVLKICANLKCCQLIY